MKLGFGKIDIIPALPVCLTGYALNHVQQT